MNLLNEKSVSVAQQRIMGAALNCKRTGDCRSPSIKKIAQGMSEKDLRDFAKTKHKNLPYHKKFKSFKEYFEIRQREEANLTKE
jgi:ribulose kinase